MRLTAAKQAHLCRQIGWTDLDESAIRQLVDIAKREDLAGFGFHRPPEHPMDVTTSLMPAGKRGQARVSARQALVVCGMELVPLILEVYGAHCHFQVHHSDGTLVGKGEPLGRLEGPVLELLQAERVLLNFLQHLCGVATHTQRFVQALQSCFPAGQVGTRLLDTRKTTPGYRALEKYAFATGGGWNHRLGLYDRVLLKDNHLAAAGAVQGVALAETVRLARRRYPDLLVEVEVDHCMQLAPVLEAGAEIVLLDNFTPTQVKEAVALVAGRALLEASGGIQLDTIRAYAETGVDFISTGAPVHQAVWVDIGLDWNSS